MGKVNALESLLGAIEQDLGHEGMECFKAMGNISKDLEYGKFADEMIETECFKKMAPKDISRKAIKACKK